MPTRSQAKKLSEEQQLDSISIETEAPKPKRRKKRTTTTTKKKATAKKATVVTLGDTKTTTTKLETVKPIPQVSPPVEDPLPPQTPSTRKPAPSIGKYRQRRRRRNL